LTLCVAALMLAACYPTGGERPAGTASGGVPVPVAVAALPQSGQLSVAVYVDDEASPRQSRLVEPGSSTVQIQVPEVSQGGHVFEVVFQYLDPRFPRPDGKPWVVASWKSPRVDITAGQDLALSVPSADDYHYPDTNHDGQDDLHALIAGVDPTATPSQDGGTNGADSGGNGDTGSHSSGGNSTGAGGADSGGGSTAGNPGTGTGSGHGTDGTGGSGSTNGGAGSGSGDGTGGAGGSGTGDTGSGSNGSGTVPIPPPPPDGIWLAHDTTTNTDSFAILYGGRLVMNTGGRIYTGTYAEDLANQRYSGSLDIYDAGGAKLTPEPVAFAAARTDATLMLTIDAGNVAPSLSSPLMLTYNSLYDRGSDLSRLAQSWQYTAPPDYVLLLPIASDGTIGAAAADSRDCHYEGTLSPVDARYNVYGVSMTLEGSGCGGDGALAGDHYVGYACLFPDDNSLIIIASNGSTALLLDLGKS
jgi:hypothetical protein